MRFLKALPLFLSFLSFGQLEELIFEGLSSTDATNDNLYTTTYSFQYDDNAAVNDDFIWEHTGGEGDLRTDLTLPDSIDLSQFDSLYVQYQLIATNYENATHNVSVNGESVAWDVNYTQGADGNNLDVETSFHWSLQDVNDFTQNIVTSTVISDLSDHKINLMSFIYFSYFRIGSIQGFSFTDLSETHCMNEFSHPDDQNTCIDDYNSFDPLIVEINISDLKVFGYRSIATGIEDQSDLTQLKLIGTYNLQGQKISPYSQGLIIQRYSDGSSKKVWLAPK